MVLKGVVEVSEQSGISKLKINQNWRKKLLRAAGHNEKPLIDKKSFHITYKKKTNGRTVKRKVDPLRIRGQTLVAFDHHRGAMRTFHLNRIIDMKKTAAFKSESQHRKFRVLLEQGKITKAKFNEWMDDTKEKATDKQHPIKELPEKVASIFSGFMKQASVLSIKGRGQISPQNFVFPEHKKYPIHDLAHARNALARVAQFGSSDEQQQVRDAVYRKYPALKNRHEQEQD